jgi:hypothetical protein
MYIQACGDKVFAKWSGSQYTIAFPGSISVVHSHDKFDVKFDDANKGEDKETKIAHIKPALYKVSLMHSRIKQ